MEYLEAYAKQQLITQESVQASHALKNLSGGGALGLTPDSVKSTAEWREAKKRYDLAFAAERAFNGWFVKEFKKN